MTNALVPFGDLSLSETVILGRTLSASGFFEDAKQEAQAVVKILAGRELGFGPVASMTGINIIKGKVSLSANLMAAAVKRNGYNYRVTAHDAEHCSIEFFENGQSVGVSSFSMDDAKQAGLLGGNWAKFPRNMLFARAMSNGAKWFCADIFGGPVYTPDELGADTDGETGEIITMPSRPTPRVAQGNARQATAELFGDYDPDLDEAERETRDLDGPPTAARSWPASTIQAVMDAGIARPEAHVVKMLNLSNILSTADEVDLVLAWSRHYRKARAGGKEPGASAEFADDQIKEVAAA